jgi:hypothetical protein
MYIGISLRKALLNTYEVETPNRKQNNNFFEKVLIVRIFQLILHTDNTISDIFTGNHMYINFS